MRYRKKPRIVEVFQITEDIEVTAPTWLINKIGKDIVFIDRTLVDGHRCVYGVSVYFYGNVQHGRIGDYLTYDKEADIITVYRKDDFDLLFEIV